MAIKVVDTGADAYLKAITKLSKTTTVKVGFIQKAEDDHEGISIGELAAIHEFGLGNVPRRSMLAEYVDANQQEIERDVEAAGKRAADYRRSRPGTQPQALKVELGRIAAKHVGKIQERIANGIAPELDSETIRRKGSSTPLVDTGQLKSSVTWEIEDK